MFGRLHFALLSRRLVLAVCFTSLFLIGSSLAAPSAGAADDQVAWGIRTASNTYGKARQNFSYSIQPGSSVKDGLVISNRGAAPLTLALYAADAHTTDSGQLDLAQPTDKATSIGAWLQVDRPSVTIQPGASVAVPFTLSIPENATPGDHLGGIVTSLVRDDAAQGITVDRRLALRVQTRVSGDLIPQLRVEDLTVDYTGGLNPLQSGTAKVSYTVVNSGNAILAAEQRLTVAGPGGLGRTSAPDLANAPELLPGERWQVSTSVPDAPAYLRLGAEVQLTPLLTDASGTTSTLSPSQWTAHTWAVPWTLLLLLPLLAGLGYVVLLRRRRRQADEAARVERAVQEALLAREAEAAVSGSASRD